MFAFYNCYNFYLINNLVINYVKKLSVSDLKSHPCIKDKHKLLKSGIEILLFIMKIFPIEKIIITNQDERGIFYLNLNRPEIMNAFDDELIHQLNNIFLDLRNNKNIKALVVTGNGKGFSAGADLSWMRRMSDVSREENYNDSMKLAEMLNTLYNLPFPTIAAVNGAAYGGGVGFVTACDIAVANKYAKFCLSEARLGLIPSVISPYVVKAVGERNAKYLFFTSAPISSEEAVKIGMVNFSVENEELESTVEEIILKILQGGPEAIKSAKKLIYYVESKEINEKVMNETAKRIANSRASSEGKEGISAFLNKRKPNWQE